MKRQLYLLFSLCLFLLFSCKEESKTLFTRLSENSTGITFRNLLKEEDPRFNIIFYPYFYNGGGVAIGDVNNDGLQDVFFTGNMVKNRLFINKGEFDFEDVTTESHIAEKEGWCTGATMIDINQDGWLDIYICRSGIENASFRKNLLFINNHDLTFTEKAVAYGLDDAGYSTQASFFDYDRDGDLDMMLINQSQPKFSQGKIDFEQQHHQTLDSVYRNKLFRNDGEKFTDVSSHAGIRSDVLTFSLGVSTSDINSDGWPDIYIANDFKEPDYYYINNGNGTFTESLKTAMGHTSLYSMGVDVADYNNDFDPDIIVLDMLSEGNRAQKMHMGGDSYTQYNYLFTHGMFPQYMKNSLQKNNGDGTFSEIGQLAGVSNTDWSWSPLLADYDNDGLKDLFITNGYKRDNTDIEFVIYSMNQSIRIQKGGDAVNVAEYISHMPGIHLPNYIYKNAGNDKFENKIKDWGFDHNTFSHGAAYADLDNDGDLDLVTNNTDDYAGVYRNNAEKLGNNFIKIKLKGYKENLTAIGTKLYLYGGGQKIMVEQNPVRGYQSAADPVLHAGLGKLQKLDSIVVIWPNQATQTLMNISANQTLSLEITQAVPKINPDKKSTTLFHEVAGLDHRHKQKSSNDFQRQFLLMNDYSHRGPCLAKADVNNDGLEDLFVGGARGQQSKIFIQSKNRGFVDANDAALKTDSLFENMDAVFFDADLDGDQDLYVVSGGYALAEQSPQYADRLYLNNGKGVFSKSKQNVPAILESKGCVAAADFDGDKDVDLFIGGHVKPGRFPEYDSSRILVNDGHGRFNDATRNVNSMINNLGIVNAALWKDMNGDNLPDLVVASEWEPLKVFYNQKMGKLGDAVMLAGAGLWSSLLVDDIDNDGDNDIVAGNYGLNSQLKVDEAHPLEMYYADFDGNGSVDPLMTHYIGDKSFPMIPRDDLNGQIPIMKKKFSSYELYADATINEVLSPEQLKMATKAKVTNLQTVWLENTNGKFKMHPLPIEAQYAPVHAMISGDFNADGVTDLILTGNQSYNRIYLTRHDANYGEFLSGDGKGNFNYVPQYKSGLCLRGDVKDAIVIGDRMVFGVNSDSVVLYQIK
jgi:hypothetical protein